MNDYEITITYTENEGVIGCSLKTDGCSPYTLIGIFEHFIDRLKEKLGDNDTEFLLPDQEN